MFYSNGNRWFREASWFSFVSVEHCAQIEQPASLARIFPRSDSDLIIAHPSYVIVINKGGTSFTEAITVLNNAA